MPLEYEISDLSFLIVYGNKYMRSIIKTMLSGFGVKTVIEAKDGARAFEAFRTHAVDVIVVDQQMGPLDGNAFVQHVRTASDSPDPFVPIIMLTASTGRKSVARARDAGITEVLGKPICAKDLYSHVIQAIDHPRRFIRSKKYSGPDRRRSSDDNYEGKERRNNIVEI